MRNDVENGQEYLTTDVRRVVARYYFYASYFFVFFFYFLRCLAQFSPASLSCTRQSNLFPCKITTHGHRPGCSTVCNYVKTMLIEIAWKNPFIMPVGKEKGKQRGWMVRGHAFDGGQAEEILLAEGYKYNKKIINYANIKMYAK